MKIAVNKCYGGFSLSKKAVAWIAKKQGRNCFFFTHKDGDFYSWVTDDSEKESLMWTAFDIPNPNEAIQDQKNWREMSLKEREKSNLLYRKHEIENSDYKRNDPILISCIEVLGKQVNGLFADIEVVEIPDDVAWEIQEYDGLEHIAEKHRTW